MASNRSSARGSRKGEIPRNFIRNWHSSGSTRGASPLVRRPITACQSCRAAKVKCDGQQDCSRCNSRGMVCRYVNTETGETPFPQQQSQQSQQPQQQSPAGTVVSPATIYAAATSEPTSITTELDAMDAGDHFTFDTMAYQPPLLDSMADWANETISQSLDDLDWRAMDPGLSHDPPSSDLGAHMFEPRHSLFEASNPTYTPITPAAYSSASATSVSPAPLSPSQLFTSPDCNCREGLAMLVPRLKGAVQDRHLDEVVKVTSEVLKSCQGIIDCTSCQITCTDLICMMAVFQQTDSCFDYISRAELDGSMKLNFGGHEIPIDDPNLRAMLVMDLVQQATMVLDAISTKGQTMLRMLGSPSLLARANIGYLETVIGDFRKLLRAVADSSAADEPAYASSARRGSTRSSTRILDAASR
ncbi:hypothetical protein B0H67DRAFT_568467 [Lasiosphaeris hirsuta]|uniref:Zn(2)-C6 fungal-type domain-containing protein n=1 Tax=Lasiosphaeris hirsuta TaxID=260670 RepID=A0AA40AZ42_9PEZI|nr:hypothetical protein B0H67DRAFT_568467 [Lasiosphaeris hirsuta]